MMLSPHIINGYKQCPRCKEVKHLTEYSKDKHHSSGRKSACKVCAKKDFYKWKNENYDLAKKIYKISYYVNFHGLTEEEAHELIKCRNGICEICGETKKLVIDHCHINNLTRGRVCTQCNSLLGYSRDSIEILSKAIKYLEESNDKRSKGLLRTRKLERLL